MDNHFVEPDIYNAAKSVTSLVFIDPGIEDYSTLATRLLPGCYGVVLSATEDGVSQISRVLSGFRQVFNLHIVAHGDVGSLALGSTKLSNASLGGYLDQLASWSDFLDRRGQICLYSCRTAPEKAGQ